MLKASKYEAGHKIRFLRVVIDDDVDRMQVYRWRHHSRALLIARSLFFVNVSFRIVDIYVQYALYFLHCVSPSSGDYSTGVPPLPIPNREVKPSHADGTA